MKITVFLSVVMLLLCVNVVVSQSLSVKIGDVDFNGTITATDKGLIYKHVKGIIHLTPDQQRVADVNGDGKVDAADMDLLQLVLVRTGDQNGDGVVNQTDYLLLHSALGTKSYEKKLDVNRDGKFDWNDVKSMEAMVKSLSGTQFGNTVNVVIPASVPGSGAKTVPPGGPGQGSLDVGGTITGRNGTVRDIAVLFGNGTWAVYSVFFENPAGHSLFVEKNNEIQRLDSPGEQSLFNFSDGSVVEIILTCSFTHLVRFSVFPASASNKTGNSIPMTLKFAVKNDQQGFPFTKGKRLPGFKEPVQSSRLMYNKSGVQVHYVQIGNAAWAFTTRNGEIRKTRFARKTIFMEHFSDGSAVELKMDSNPPKLMAFSLYPPGSYPNGNGIFLNAPGTGIAGTTPSGTVSTGGAGVTSSGGKPSKTGPFQVGGTVPGLSGTVIDLVEIYNANGVTVWGVTLNSGPWVVTRKNGEFRKSRLSPASFFEHFSDGSAVELQIGSTWNLKKLFLYPNGVPGQAGINTNAGSTGSGTVNTGSGNTGSGNTGGTSGTGGQGTGSNSPLPLPDVFNIVQEVHNQDPSLIKNSDVNNDFLFEVVRRLRKIDKRWGLNWKRGVIGDMSQDVIDYHWGSGPRDNSTEVYIIDIITGHSGPDPRPGWIDVTGATAAAGTVGKWTIAPMGGTSSSGGSTTGGSSGNSGSGTTGGTMQPLSTVPHLPEYDNATIDTSSDERIVESAARYVKENYPQLMPVGDDRDTMYKMMTVVIGIIRAKGYDVTRVVNHPSRPVGHVLRYGSDALVLNGFIYDCFGACGEKNDPMALNQGPYEAGRLRE